MPTQKVVDSNIRRLTERIDKVTASLTKAQAKEATAVARRTNLESVLSTAKADLAFWQTAPVDGVAATPEAVTQEPLFEDTSVLV